SVVGVSFTGKERGDLVAVGPVGKLGKAADPILDQRVVAFAFGQFDQLGSVGKLALERACRINRFLEPPTLAHDVLRRLGIIPQGGIFYLGVQFLEPLERTIPVEEAAQKRGRGIDLVDMGLRFGAHRSNSLIERCVPALLERVHRWQASGWLPGCCRRRRLGICDRTITGWSLLLLLLLLLLQLLLLPGLQGRLPLSAVVRIANRASKAS